MRSINDVLDHAKTVQKVQSDYKLGLCLGIGLSSLSNYRSGRSFPDEKTCEILASAMGEKPDLLMVEMQAQRTKDAKARAMWANLAKRLQSGFANCKLLLVLAIVSIAGAALPAWAAIGAASFSANSLYIMLRHRWGRSYYRFAPHVRQFVKLCKAGLHVSRHPHPAAVRPA